MLPDPPSLSAPEPPGAPARDALASTRPPLEASGRGSRRTRVDALPENLEYRDAGCDLYPACLRCPLPRCRYDDAGGAQAMLRSGRNAEVRRAREAGATIAELATRWPMLSRRTLFRICRDG